MEDNTIPEETLIYFSKVKTLFNIAISIGCFGLGIYFILNGSYIWGGGISVVGMWLSYDSYKETINKAPQIILNSKGIQTSSTPFYSWAELSDEKAIIEGSGSKSRFYLIFDHPKGNEVIDIENLTTDVTHLEKLLKVYRKRYEISISRAK